MRNKLTDVHNHLCVQLERLNDDDFEDLTEEESHQSKNLSGMKDLIRKPGLFG